MSLPENQVRLDGLDQLIAAVFMTKVNDKTGMSAMPVCQSIHITINEGKTREEMMPHISAILAASYREVLAASENVC